VIVLQYIWTGFLVLFLVFYVYVNYFETGMFEQVVLKDFNSSQFVSMTVIKHLNDGSTVVKYTNNPDEIKSLLSYFEKFKLTQFNGEISRKNNCYYYISLYTNKPHEGIIIEVMNENYINVLLEKTKTYHMFVFNLYDNMRKDKNYKIVNKNINCKTLDNIFNSIGK